MSDNDSVTSQAQQYGGCNQEQRRLKRCIFRPLRKTDSDDADVTCCGTVFQTRAAATGKARSLIVLLTTAYDVRTISDDEEAERRRRRAWKSAGCLKFVGKVRQCCSVLTRLDKERELEINSLPCLQPVQLA